MKAVIWTDVAQSFVIFLGVVLSIIFGKTSTESQNDCKDCFKGFINAGGVSKVFERAMNDGRIKLIEQIC